jgi:hypothetical protein
MNNAAILLGTVLAMTAFAGQKAAKADMRLESCHQLWAQRPNSDKINQAASCYQELADSLARETDADSVRVRKLALEAQLEANFYIAERYKGTEAEASNIAAGLAAADKLVAEHPESTSGYYWRACFTTKDAERKDRGRVLPTNIMGALRKIRGDLAIAMDKQPSYHRYGPYRVYGMMQVMAPAFPAGGNAQEGEMYLRRAYDMDWAEANRSELRVYPLALNAIFLAEGLTKRGKRDEARQVLNRLISNNPSVYGEDKRPDTLEDQAKARSMLESLGR